MKKLEHYADEILSDRHDGSIFIQEDFVLVDDWNVCQSFLNKLRSMKVPHKLHARMSEKIDGSGYNFGIEILTNDDVQTH